MLLRKQACSKSSSTSNFFCCKAEFRKSRRPLGSATDLSPSFSSFSSALFLRALLCAEISMLMFPIYFLLGHQPELRNASMRLTREESLFLLTSATILTSAYSSFAACQILCHSPILFVLTPIIQHEYC